METDIIVEEISKKGYAIVKNFFEREKILCLNEVIDGKVESKISVPFTNTPHGFGNLLDRKEFSFLYSDPGIKIICEKIFKTKSFSYNHLIVHNKPPWVGIGHEWHQESSNIRSFAPGKNWEIHWKDFLQIFVPIEEHRLENGCLKLIPGSHNLGLLEHEDIVTAQLSHKRRIKSECLQSAANQLGIINCEVDPGDVIFFNHLIAHGSSNNNSNKRRRVAVMQARKDDFEKDEEILKKELNYRVDFAIRSLESRVREHKRDRVGYYDEVTKYTIKSMEEKNE